MTYPVIMKGITKIYPNGTIANKDVDFSLAKGEIHALLGENGAGKSTLMHVLFGMDKKTYGDIHLYGQSVELNSPMDALKHKIGMVHQHFMLVPSMTIAENIILGSEKAKFGVINLKEKIEMANAFCKKYNFNIDCSRKIENVSVGVRQKVEILKALYRGAEVLILDEPTAVLTPQETEELFLEIRSLRDHGASIIFISHKLNEVKSLCDRITIMRHGKSLGVYNIEDLSEEDISAKMVGREVILSFDKQKVDTHNVKLHIRNLSYVHDNNKKALDNISLDVKGGEILGVAGVDGNGQSQLVERIVGLNKNYEGSIKVNNTDIKQLSIKQIRDLGLRFIPEDRMKDGCAKDDTIFNNLMYDRLRKGEFRKKKFLLDFDQIMQYGKDKVKEFGIACSSIRADVASLSGGNIQKVIVAREFDSSPDLIIANQPTRGIDVGAAELVRRKIIDLRTSGSAVLLVSADLNEILEVSDKVIVLYQGEIVAYIEAPKKVTETDLGYYMLGVRRQKSVVGAMYEE